MVTKECQKVIFVNINKDATLLLMAVSQYMHQIACIYIVVPLQMWNNTYLETTYKLESGK